MFAAARYNAHTLLSLDPDAQQNREAAVSYFLEQYRSMLEENIDWLAQSLGNASDFEPGSVG
jgi:hypothetical protein